MTEAIQQRDMYLERLRQAQNTLAQWQKYEAELRQFVAATYFTEKDTGTETIPLGNGGWKVSCNKRINTSVQAKDKMLFDSVREQLGDQLFGTSYRLRMGEYNKLTPEQQRIANKVVTFKQALPSIEFKEPSK